MEIGYKHSDCFDKWINNAAVKTKEMHRDLMILDQFMFQLPHEIRVLVRDSNPQSVKEEAALVNGSSS